MSLLMSCSVVKIGTGIDTTICSAIDTSIDKSIYIDTSIYTGTAINTDIDIDTAINITVHFEGYYFRRCYSNCYRHMDSTNAS